MSTKQEPVSTEQVQTITFAACDGVNVMMTMNAVKQNVTIKNMIDDLGYNEDDGPIPLPSIDSPTLERVKEFCEHYVNYVPRQWELNWPDEIDPSEPHGFDAEFIDKYDKKENMQELFNLIYAANYLDNKRLLNLCCKKVAMTIKDKSVEEIREYLNVENDFTPEEWEEVKNETFICE